MKVTKIGKMLATALKVRNNGKVVNFCFEGESGIGKTEMVQQFAESIGYPCKSLIISQLDSNDFVGLLYREQDELGGTVSAYAPPKFWPKSGKGILFLDEVNRGRDEVRAPLLQLLHERRVHDYKLPDGWMIVAAINPDTDAYGVGSLDTAMTSSRLKIVKVEFDMPSFIEHAEKSGYHPQVVDFLKSGAWTYVTTDKIANDAGAKYLCPRDWKSVSDMKLSEPELDSDVMYHRELMCESLGANIGEMFHKYCFEESPVTAQDILSSKKKSLAKLKKLSSNPTSNNAASLSSTVDSIVTHFSGEKKVDGKIHLDLMLEVADVINANLAVYLVRQCLVSPANDLGVDEFIETIKKKRPDLIEALRTGVDLNNKLKPEVK